MVFKYLINVILRQALIISAFSIHSSTYSFSQLSFPITHSSKIADVTFSETLGHFASIDSMGLVNINDIYTRRQLFNFNCFPIYTLEKKVYYSSDTLYTFAIDYDRFNSGKRQIVVQVFLGKGNYQKLGTNEIFIKDISDINELKSVIIDQTYFLYTFHEATPHVILKFKLSEALIKQNNYQTLKNDTSILRIEKRNPDGLINLRQINSFCKIIFNNYIISTYNGLEYYSPNMMPFDTCKIVNFNNGSDFIIKSNTTISHFNINSADVIYNIRNESNLELVHYPSKLNIEDFVYFNQLNGQIFQSDIERATPHQIISIADEISKVVYNSISHKIFAFSSKFNAIRTYSMKDGLADLEADVRIQKALKKSNGLLMPFIGQTSGLDKVEFIIDHKTYKYSDTVIITGYSGEIISKSKVIDFAPLKRQYLLLFLRDGKISNVAGSQLKFEYNLRMIGNSYKSAITIDFSIPAVVKIEIELGECYPKNCSYGVDYYRDITLCADTLGDLVITYDFNNDFIVWSGPDKGMSFECNQKLVYTNIEILNDSMLIAYTYNGVLSLYNFKRKLAVYHLFLLNGEYIVFSENGYYKGSKALTKYLSMSFGAARFPFELMEECFNKPSKVLKAVGSNDVNLIGMYQRLENKRAKGDCPDTTFHKFIRAQFINTVQKIKAYNNTDEISLSYSVLNVLNSQLTLNIFINGTPIYSINGKKLKISSRILDSVTIELNEGVNKIELFVMDSYGNKSNVQDLVITKKPKGKYVPKTIFIGIAYDKFIDTNYNLKYPSKDILDLNEILKEKYKNCESFLFINSLLGPDQINEIRKKLDKLSVDDIIICHFSGHGVLDADLNYFLATNKTNFNRPNSKDCFMVSTLLNIIDGVQCRKKIIFLDACHSGEVDKEEVEQLAQASTTNGDVKFRAAGAGIQKKNLGLKTTSELMGELFTDLRRGTGATVISSAGGAEYAMESDTWKNGLFTYCLLHGLKDKAADANNDGQIMLSELQNYLRTEVTKLSNGAQQPTSRIENLSMDFRVW